MTAPVALGRAPAELHHQLTTLLAQLGAEPVDVADRLRADGVRGVRGSALGNPVCRWLIRYLPDVGAALGTCHLHGFQAAEASGRVALVPLPAAVTAFADRFDHGHYPELELPLHAPPLDPAAATPGLGAEPAAPSLSTDTVALPIVRAQPS